MEETQQAPPPSENPFDFGELDNEIFGMGNRFPILQGEQKYYIEKQIYVALLKNQIDATIFNPPTPEELSILSFGVRKLLAQNNYNGQNFSTLRPGTMSRILSFFSHYLNNRAPVDAANIWKLVQGNKKIDFNSTDFEQMNLPERKVAISYPNKFNACLQKRKILFYNPKKLIIGNLDSNSKNVIQIPNISLIRQSGDAFFVLSNNSEIIHVDERNETELFMKIPNKIVDFKVSQTISPTVAALSADKSQIFFGSNDFGFCQQNCLKLANQVNHFELYSSKLCFSTYFSFYIFENDRISTSYTFSKEMKKFRLIPNESAAISFDQKSFEMIDFRIPGRVFTKLGQTRTQIDDLQISPLNHIFSLSHQNDIAFYDLRNPQQILFHCPILSNTNIPSYKMKWIGDDKMFAVASNDGTCKIYDVDSTANLLNTYSIPVDHILGIDTTHDTILISQPNTINVFQMNSRPILIPTMFP
ncbi:hypothetical protein TRFO_04467 [Tritrichomonas foetus]|uniref:Uncharacterized protein n=1 Tax=Tritrichomonas foetus TaxID=1144522 RepID=A0A1J4KEN9_9EUKA|nr:hypothetical protein TRFO_04467 [Tritrichomonas foetus]|eukprot:OHT09911.1 hypothetical protein TRFO_04467 [Tritrichomonas foetus]